MVEPADETYIVETKVEDNNYKKIIHKDGKMCIRDSLYTMMKSI